ncbi:hypothetical protein N657DRAFT_29920 [Parathielavia appendiculata]|uniref:Uncharacterized protein n=1 Tax=Parathielavia appendiculata TaxID=2587402 RepID=A0AAN6Z7G1_9PEZI|nr:hypothetical protein N657DRAFT_29920 [Parathielavia appendiculata]
MPRLESTTTKETMLSILPTSAARPSTCQSARDGIPSSGSAERPENPKSCGRKLKLKVSRGALAKARRSKGGRSGSSWNSLNSSSEPILEKRNSRQPLTTLLQPSQRSGSGMHLDKTRSTTAKRAAQDEFLALLFTDIDHMNGKALRRLKKRFPDLEARLTEVRLLQPERPITAGNLKAEETRGVAETKRTRRRHPGRFPGRLVKWIGRARQAVTRTRRAQGGVE